MSESKHTPGPWRYEAHYGFVMDRGDVVLAQTWTKSEENCPNHLANGPLIAAAPEMYEGLTAVLELIESGQLRRNTSDDANPDYAMRQIPFVMALAKAAGALAKAEGRT